MANNPKEALPTQQFVDIKGVKNGVLILKGGGLRQIILVSGINFDLKSEDEQNAITASYQNFLNSLSFSLQIFIHSRKVNIEAYLEGIAKIEVQETNPLLKTQIAEYGEFIKSFTKENAIMNKSFFIVVPYDAAQIPGGSKTSGFFGKIFGRKDLGSIEEEDEKRFQQHAGQLAQRTEQIVSGLSQIGIRAVPLNDAEIVELLYNLYNPEAMEKKGMELGEDKSGIRGR